MDRLISEYLKDRKDGLVDLYHWSFDIGTPQQRFGIEIKGNTWLEKTIELKAGLRSSIEANASDEYLEEVAEYFIKDWGGIKRFSKAKEVVRQFRNVSGTATAPIGFTPKFQSISSWSKWASLVCPKWACIYDTRVAYSINSINYLGGGSFKIFPTPEGRNTRLNSLDVSTLILSTKIKVGDKSDPKEIRRNYYVSESEAYKEYLFIVRGVSQRLWKDEEHIHEVEMLLFALADTDVYESVFKHLQGRSTYSHR